MNLTQPETVGAHRRAPFTNVRPLPTCALCRRTPFANVLKEGRTMVRYASLTHPTKILA
ncbi:MAG: hypothetical protein RIE73_30350 [Coleofasciculus sp. C1-SOL-03]|uniref:hypothetical protein n=1 Tax=Coleofasciculus sp. C1-SOL-03 TaxID=3069522 RepID=UPI0032F2A05A